MKNILLGIILGIASMSLPAQTTPKVIQLEELESLLAPENDSLYVINFWATWCRPCVAELPSFEQVNAEFSDKKMKMYLVTLDWVEDMETKLIPFIQKRGLKAEVLLLDESDGNKFIDKVDPSWSGAIPATIMINDSKNIRKFYEQSFEYEELKTFVETYISE